MFWCPTREFFVRFKTNRIAVGLGLLGSVLAVGVAHGQLRIVSYNTLDKPVNATDESEFQTIFGAIANESLNGIARPVDILTLQEQRDFSGSSTTQDIAAALNDLHGTTGYTADVLGLGSDRVSVVYNADTVTLLDSRLVAAGIRPAYRGHFQPVGYEDAGSDFYVYSAHLKAGSSSSDFSQRASEATNIRSNADALGQGANILYTGDFNLQQSSDAAYQNFVASGDGQAVDPTGAPFWNILSPELMTQSTRSSTQSDGGAAGGLDDRFDFQLVTAEVNDGEGFAIISDISTGAAETSYRAFGNDGVSYNQAINANLTGRSQPAAVLNALHDFSDHLPVVADYQLPALMQIDATPAVTQAFVSELAGFFGGVQNAAPVNVAAGADELDYSATASGDVDGPGTFNATADPLAAANTHGFAFDTATAGEKTASFDVTSLSQGVADQMQSVSINVFDHANGSFAEDSALNTLTIDFGSVEQFADDGTLSPGVFRSFDLFNIEATPGFTSGLSLGALVAVSGDTDVLSLGSSPSVDDLAAGTSSGRFVSLQTPTVGNFSATWEIIVGDALDIAGALSETLTLNLIGEVIAAGFIDGDYNGDGFVSQADLDLVLLNWGDTSVPGTWLAAEQFDGVQVSQNELDGVLLNWGNGTPSGNAAIPEPTSAAGLVVLGGLLGRCRSWRRTRR